MRQSLQNAADQAIDANATQAADQLAHFQRILLNGFQILIATYDLGMTADTLQFVLALMLDFALRIVD